LEEIRDNLPARIAEAIREGWLGEVEGLQVSLAGARDKIRQLDAAVQRHATAVRLAMPSFAQVAGRSPAGESPHAATRGSLQDGEQIRMSGDPVDGLSRVTGERQACRSMSVEPQPF
jgi:hypothetical protein